MSKSAFWVALTTSFVVAVCAYFVLFFLLRADIMETRSLVAQTVAEQDAVLQKTFDSTLSVFQEAVVDTISEAKESVVSIVATRNVQLYMMGPDRSVSVAEQERQVGGGSGIIVSKSGYVITNKHVVQDTDVSYTVILSDGTTYPVKNIWIDAVLDIAVLALDIDADFDAVAREARFVSREDTVAVGQFAFAIGNALTQWQNTVTFGVISAKNRELRLLGDNIYVGLLQTDTAINPGNSGGPLLDIYGRVVGMNTAVSTFGQGIGFALPMTQEFVDATVASVVDHSTIVRPWLGVVYVDITPAVQQRLGLSTPRGIYVSDIVAGSPADNAGLSPGDIILSLNDMRIDDDAPFLYQLYTYQPGDMIRFDILRSGDRIQRDVVLDVNM